MTEQPAEPVLPAQAQTLDDGTIRLTLTSGHSVKLSVLDAELLAGQLFRAGKIHTYCTFDDEGIATWHSNQHPVLVARALFALGQSLARGVYGAPATPGQHEGLASAADKLAEEIQAHLAEQAKGGDQA